MRRLIASLLIAAFSLTTTACIGRMGLSGKVMEFNLNVASGRFAREIVFLILYVIPVYPISGLLDLLIFNSIEFWTGTNPINGEDRLARAGDTKEIAGPNGELGVATLREDDSIDIEITQQDGTTHFVKLARDDNGVSVWDAEGKLVGWVDQRGQVEIAQALPN